MDGEIPKRKNDILLATYRADPYALPIAIAGVSILPTARNIRARGRRKPEGL